MNIEMYLCIFIDAVCNKFLSAAHPHHDHNNNDDHLVSLSGLFTFRFTLLGHTKRFYEAAFNTKRQQQNIHTHTNKWNYMHIIDAATTTTLWER